jgi:septum formation protein
MRGRDHQLHTAADMFQAGRPFWRSVRTVTLHMRDFSDVYLAQYVETNWNIVRHCVGGYALEGTGAQLFSKIDGDYFSVMVLPLLDVLTFLTERRLLQN